MFREAPTEEEAKRFGLTIEEASHVVHLWPENHDAVATFAALANQWRMGPAGAFALDYTAIPAVLELKAIPRHEWSSLFDDIRVMEGEALKLIHHKRRAAAY